MYSMSSARESRAIARGFNRRQRDFDNRPRDLDAEEATRRRNNLPDPALGPPNSPEAEQRERRIDGLRSIRGVPGIAHSISEFLPEARDRSHLNSADAGSFVDPVHRGVLCLPTGETFRTNADPESGCGPFTTVDALQCCVQEDLGFCVKVAAILRRRWFQSSGLESAGRIAKEILEWVQENNPDLILNTVEVELDTSRAGDVKLQDFAILVRTFAPLAISISRPNEMLHPDLRRVGGTIRVRAAFNTVATVPFASLRNLVTSFGSRANVIIDCPVDMGGSGVDDVANMIITSARAIMPDIQYEFDVPFAIPVRDVGQQILAINDSGRWFDRPRRHNGPIYFYGGRQALVSYDIQRNRIFVQCGLQT